MSKKSALLLKKADFMTFVKENPDGGIVVNLGGDGKAADLKIDFFLGYWDKSTNRISKGEQLKLSYQEGYDLEQKKVFKNLEEGVLEYSDLMKMNSLDFCFIFNVQLEILLNGVEDRFMMRGVPFYVAETLGHQEYFNVRFYAFDGPAVSGKTSPERGPADLGSINAVSASPCPPYWYYI